MQIKIADRFKPFSHTPGVNFLLPHSSFNFKIFPCKIIVEDLSGNEKKEIGSIELHFEGPLKDFTVQQDLDKGLIKIWGRSPKGFLRYCILPGQENSFFFEFEKAPEDFIPKTKSESLKKSLSKRPSQLNFKQLETLSLGINKSQDWNAIHRRNDIREIFPIWLRLGQLVSHSQEIDLDQPSLFKSCLDTLDRKDRNDALAAFKKLYLAGFYEGMTPRLADDDFQGFSLPIIVEKSSPLALLYQGYKLIRKLFFEQKGNHISILPLLPSDLVSGRFLNIYCEEKGRCDIEWSKKQVRRMIFHAEETAELKFIFQKDIKQFRLRSEEKDKGKICANNATISVTKGVKYLFDQFK